jgi:hypothetical protein
LRDRRDLEMEAADGSRAHKVGLVILHKPERNAEFGKITLIVSFGKEPLGVTELSWVELPMTGAP